VVFFPPHELQVVNVCSKSVSNEGHFTLDTKAVFPHYLASHCSEMTEISCLVLPSHPLQVLQVLSKSISKEVHFALNAKPVSRPCLASHFTRVTEI
jgi:hypothetical protein